VLLILPPSETKRDGGADGSTLALSSLGFADLTSQREATIAALRRLSRSVSASTEALGLGLTQRFEIDRNRALLSSPTMSAMDRYTGVVYDALGAETLDASARQFAGDHLVIGSALFGLLRANDPIPAYRLSHDSRLSALRLRRHWPQAIEAVLDRHSGVVLDLRSEAYAALGAAPVRDNSLYLRVVTEATGGRRVALSHFNKHAKGVFTRAVLEAGITHESIDSIIDWGKSAGHVLERGAQGELHLVV
jgi:uncharacterized protein